MVDRPFITYLFYASMATCGCHGYIQNAASHVSNVNHCASGQSVKHHLLSSYYHATLAVVLAQFSSKGFADGRAGVVRLAETSTHIQVARGEI